MTNPHERVFPAKISLAAFLLEDYELTKTGDSGQNFGLSGNY